MSRLKPDPTLRGLYTDAWAKGDPVWVYAYTGCTGVKPLVGVVEGVGPRTFTVLWETGHRSRLRHGEPRSVRHVNCPEFLEVFRQKFPDWAP